MSNKPKSSELRRKFEFTKASFAIEGIHFTEKELEAFEVCIRRRYRGTGMRAYFNKHFPPKRRAGGIKNL